MYGAYLNNEPDWDFDDFSTGVQDLSVRICPRTDYNHLCSICVDSGEAAPTTVAEMVQLATSGVYLLGKAASSSTKISEIHSSLYVVHYRVTELYPSMVAHDARISKQNEAVTTHAERIGHFGAVDGFQRTQMRCLMSTAGSCRAAAEASKQVAESAIHSFGAFEATLFHRVHESWQLLSDSKETCRTELARAGRTVLLLGVDVGKILLFE